MKEIVAKLNKVFDNRIRLAAMSALMVNECLDFNTLKQTLEVTDGNLASHIAALEEEGYVKVTKKFVDDEGEYCVEIETHAINQRNEDCMPGRSTVALPSREKGIWPLDKRARREN